MTGGLSSSSWLSLPYFALGAELPVLTKIDDDEFDT